MSGATIELSQARPSHARHGRDEDGAPGGGRAPRPRLPSAVIRETLPSLARQTDGHGVQSVLAAALGDPSLELFVWRPSVTAYVNTKGSRFDPERIGERSVTEIRHDDRLVAAVVHDRALEDSDGFVEQMGNLGALALENLALQAELRDSASVLRASIARIASASVRERRRIERDLHDGAQNRLVALRVKLALAEQRVESSTVEELRDTLGALGDDTDAVIDSLRTIAHGVYPPVLASCGVRSALINEAALAALPIRVLETPEIARSTPAAEGAVYFCCLEAIQNAIKHAGPHAQVTICLEQSGELLTFSVADNGSGFDQATVAQGHGLTNMQDRITALGGTLDIASRPDLGTTLSGALPWPRRQPDAGKGGASRRELGSSVD
jgi:signal transduction histidine kinase